MLWVRGFSTYTWLAQLHRRQGNNGVHVVGSAHDNGVDVVLFFVQQGAVVGVVDGFRMLIAGLLRLPVVHVAQEGDAGFATFVGVGEVDPALSSGPHGGHVELVARSGVAHSAQHVAGHDEYSGGQGRLFEEGAAVGRGWVVHI